MAVKAIWGWLVGAVLLPALAVLLLSLLAPSRLESAWDWTWSALFPADTRFHDVVPPVDWNGDKQVWEIWGDPMPIARPSVVILSFVVSTKLPTNTAVEIIPRVSPDHGDDTCPRARAVSVQEQIYVPVQCVVKLQTETKYTYSVWIRPDAPPIPDDATPSLIRGSILIRDARFN